MLLVSKLLVTGRQKYFRVSSKFKDYMLRSEFERNEVIIFEQFKPFGRKPINSYIKYISIENVKSSYSTPLG